MIIFSKIHQYWNEHLQDFIKNEHLYLAHLPSNDTQSVETLVEHTKLVLDYLVTHIEKHHLENIINSLITQLVPNGLPHEKEVQNFIKRLFYESVLYHDFGKLNHLFQSKKMLNKHQDHHQIVHEEGSNHSIISTYLFIMHQEAKNESTNFNDEELCFLSFLILAFSYPILKHHSSSLYSLNFTFEEEKVNPFKEYLQLLKTEFSIIDDLHENFILYYEESINCFHEHFNTINEFSLFSLIKLNSSLLTSSDYIATAHYMNDWDRKWDNFGTIDENLRQNMIKSIQKISYNKATYEASDDVDYQIEFPITQENDNLNLLRKNMGVTMLKELRGNLDKNLFYIEAPTGGGKTNLSMLAVAELLKEHKEINKVFYVFPFTTLITQTYQSINNAFNLNNQNIVELHSKAEIKEKEQGDEVDAFYGEKLKLHLDYLFANFPITLLSHIRFFDILTSNSKKENYLLHRIANSVVVIDELQSYDPNLWDKLLYWIENYAIQFNIKFILMSATLPKLDNLAHSQHSFISLIPNKKDFFNNPNFSKRIEFDFSLLQKQEGSKIDGYLEDLANRVIAESVLYQKESCSNSVHTIIEFIFKQTASDFQKIVEETEHCFDHIFLLSGTILEPQRKKVINFLKDNENRSKNILLVTTQVVEAGVDIDMDLGFKDSSLIDSDEQLAGRINRNVKKKGCKLFLFNYNKAVIIYKNDLRYNETKISEESLHQEVLESKNFDKVYNKVFGRIDSRNQQVSNIDNLKNYHRELRRLNFQKVSNEFELIKGDNVKVFVGLQFPSSIFSSQEIDLYIQKTREINDSTIEGIKVWGIFKEYVEQRHEKRKEDFIENQNDILTLQSLMAKFTFSLFINSSEIPKLQLAGNEYKYGYLSILNGWEKNENQIYSLEKGILSEGFENNPFLGGNM
ncbi:MAG: CRISPR-associated helicase Cas3' [Candidatus Gracilibacteria bacterium]|nr:CRISPR-associated helicase Cas3' [Candidatus Gracilibacteria bacterium]